MSSTTCADPKRSASDPMGQDLRKSEWKVHCKKKEVIWELSRLLSKASYEVRGLSVEEVFIVHELNLRAIDLVERDGNYRKFFVQIESVQSLICRIQPNLSRRNGLREGFWSIGTAGAQFLQTPHEYFGAEGQGLQRASIIYRRTVRTRKYPDPPYIGVGYADKGNLTKSAENGSPHWTEVAMDEWTQLQAGNPRGYSVTTDPPLGIYFTRPEAPKSSSKNFRTVSCRSSTQVIDLSLIEV